MNDIGEYLGRVDSFLQRLDSALHFMLIHSSSQSMVDWNDFPMIFRPRDKQGVMEYWRIFLDSPCPFDQTGDAYDKYGIDRGVGAAVVLQPDRYVAKVVEPTLEGIKEIGYWMADFMISLKPLAKASI